MPEEADRARQRRLEELVARPRETLEIELKGWIDLTLREHQAGLAKALIALANLGGGFVVIGFDEHAGDVRPADGRPTSLNGYSHDVVHGVVERYAEPPFACEVDFVVSPESGEVFPVIAVPGGHRVPIRSKRGGPDGAELDNHTYYIRRPGPKSETPQSAREWDELIGGCVRAGREELLESIRVIIQGGEGVAAPHEGGPWEVLYAWIDESLARWQDQLESASGGSPSRLTHGYYLAAYSLQGGLQGLDPPRLRAALTAVEGSESGWPPWLVLSDDDRPQLIEGVIEAWVESDILDRIGFDFWRATTHGDPVPTSEP